MKAEEAVRTIDAATEGRCAGPDCGKPLTEASPSAWWCSQGCQESWQRRQVGHGPPDSPPVEGTTSAPLTAARWRPDLVTAFDDSALELAVELTAEDRREADVMDRGASGFTWRGYRHRDGRYFVRVDDGHRWVGAFTASREEAGRAMRERLERELCDARRLDPDPPNEDTVPDRILTVAYPAERRALHYWSHLPGVHAALLRWLAANGIDDEDVMAGGTAEIRDGQLTVECLVRNERGRVRCDDQGEPVIDRRTVPLVEDPPSPHASVRVPAATAEQMEQASRAVQDAVNSMVRNLRPVMRVAADAADRAAGELRRVLWLPEVDDLDDPDNPTVAELDSAVDLTPYLAGAPAPTGGYGGSVGNLLGIPMMESSLIPAGQAYLVGDGTRSGPTLVMQGPPQVERPSLRARIVAWWATQWASIRSGGLRSWLLGWPRTWWHRRHRPWGWLLVQSDRVHDLLGSSWLRLRRLLGGCPGHARRTCFPCDWVRGKAGEARGGWVDARLTADAERFQTAATRIGEQMLAAGVSTAPGLLQAARVQVAEEQARVELQMVTGDGYNAALAAARERGLSTRAMAQAAALGRWTAERGWTEGQR